MKSLFRYIIFLILLNFSFAAKAESIYPIQLYAAMLPPYTNCLGDYINGDMNRLKLSAVVRDMSKHGSTMSISVLMRVKSGNTVYLETTTPVQQIINVQGAMVDIRTENLFTSYDNNAKNLVGRGSFMSNGYCLPEGAYEFVYQVFDGTNKKLPLSEPISIYCFLNQAEPPVGVTPLDGECLDSKTSPNIVFSWMDAVAIGPKYREYSVEVKEQNGAMLASQEGLLPMFGAQSEVNNFTVVTEKSYNTNTLIMQNTSSKFQEGKTYLWRVRAVPTKVKGNADENFAYKNDGYSEWMSFKYGGCGDSVVIPKADSIDMNLRVDMTTVDTSEETGSVVVHWQDIFDNTEVDKYCAYELYVYKADNESAAKTIIPIKDGETKEYTFENLERGETYKSYIVGLTGCGTPDTIRTPHSDTVSFKLKKPESDSCMVNIDPAKCGKDDLIETLEKGSTFTANDHNVIVTITECKAGSVAGSFTGKGIVSCTIFKDKIGLNVEFEDILVNKSKELCMGTVKVITSEENNLLVNLNDLSGKKRTAPKAPSQDYPYTKKVATLDELKKDVEQYKGEVVLVGDKEIYAVGNDGEIEEVGKIVENACRPAKQSLDNSAGLVVFDVDEKYNDPKWTPYIDKSPSPFSYAQIVNGYERIGSYVVPWVSMVQGEARYIKATIQGKTKTTGTGLSGKEKDIKFYCVTDSVMTELNSEYKDGAFKVKVFGGQPDRKLTIVAMMNSTGTADECAKNSKTIGETNIYTMSYRTKTIHLVPVCTDAIGDVKTYADKINKVFAPLGRSYEFKFEDKFENEEVKSLIADGLNTEDGGNVFNNKTPEMKQLCRLYKHDENVKIDHRADAYVFLLDQNTNSKIKGYMPRTNSEGFVFTKGMTVEDIAETMTHELCHGLYGLEHTFSYGIDTMALPENIMSYSTQIGRTPSKYFQWYNIENPSDYHFPFTDSAEDGESSRDNKNETPIAFKIKNETFKYDDKYGDEEIGALFAFQLTDDIEAIDIYIDKGGNNNITITTIKFNGDEVEFDSKTDRLTLDLKNEKIQLKKEKTNTLVVNYTTNENGKEKKGEAQLNIEPYSPAFEFVLNENYNNEYFYDCGYKLIESIKEEMKNEFMAYYPTYKNGKLYSPWVGMNPEQEISLILKNLDKRTKNVAKYDRFLNLKPKFKEDDISVKIGTNELENNENISKDLARQIVSSDNMTVTIKANAKETEEEKRNNPSFEIISECEFSKNGDDKLKDIIGRFNYIVRNPITLTVDLIFVNLASASNTQDEIKSAEAAVKDKIDLIINSIDVNSDEVNEKKESLMNNLKECQRDNYIKGSSDFISKYMEDEDENNDFPTRINDAASKNDDTKNDLNKKIIEYVYLEALKKDLAIKKSADYKDNSLAFIDKYIKEEGKKKSLTAQFSTAFDTYLNLLNNDALRLKDIELSEVTGLDILGIKSSLNKTSMNKLFYKVDFKAKKFNSCLKKTDLFSYGARCNKTTELSYDILKNIYKDYNLVKSRAAKINIVNKNKDEYFILDIQLPYVCDGVLKESIPEGKPYSQVQGAHNVGQRGGFQPKADNYKETFPHEFGHWRGLLHPFVKYIIQKGKTKINKNGYYMDYNVDRKWWFIYELFQVFEFDGRLNEE